MDSENNEKLSNNKINFLKYDDEEDEERKKLKTIRIQKMPIFANSVANTSFMNKKKSKHIFD